METENREPHRHNLFGVIVLVIVLIGLLIYFLPPRRDVSNEELIAPPEVGSSANTQ